MTRYFETLLLLLVVCTTSLSLSAQEPQQARWKYIFDGKTFKGWKIVGSQAKTWIEEGHFSGHMVANTPEHTFICTKKKYRDFILEAECKLDGDLHTGFLFRCIDKPRNQDTSTVSLYGYQVKIDPTTRKWTGGVFDDFGKTWAWLYTLKESEQARQAFKMGEWNRFRIEAIGNHIKVWVNDVPTTNLRHNKYAKGYIALKIHSLGNNPEKEVAVVHYRNFRILTKDPARYSRDMGTYPLIEYK